MTDHPRQGGTIGKEAFISNAQISTYINEYISPVCLPFAWNRERLDR